MTDESLMLCVKKNDLDKAAILYERYKKKLYQFFMYKNYNDQEKSEDCVQQVFYRVIKYRQSYTEGNNFRIWVYSIAKNIQYQDFKEQVKMDAAHASYQTDEAYTLVNDEHQAMLQALKLLPEQYREVLVMSRFLGMKYDEIAEINNCSVGVIKTRAFRAINSLREAYFKIA
ncbi:RNA polymerase sigma factor [Mucilaginibacter sp. HMF5004]|uniref:RNA polymerase sigma factor n=1 Tax=Mucilaginibacter rivuli TaxID=2857527 RepID=UPI001C6020F4|nr:RNA polymerase sigma factor [Mucilaginibacter rivuli]MBW4891716.1 RNA polymerase sigma factor [Mucilaginibacter rivuli]